MKLLTATEAGLRLRVHEKTVRRWALLGLLPAVRLTSRKVLFEEAAVEKMVRDRMK